MSGNTPRTGNRSQTGTVLQDYEFHMLTCLYMFLKWLIKHFYNRLENSYPCIMYISFHIQGRNFLHISSNVVTRQCVPGLGPASDDEEICSHVHPIPQGCSSFLTKWEGSLAAIVCIGHVRHGPGRTTHWECYRLNKTSGNFVHANISGLL